jgi:hypothetical protein
MQTADEVFEPRKKPAKARSGENQWWLLMLHATWIILLGVGAWYAYTSWRFVSEGREVPATVVALERVSGSDGVSYSPVFEYRVDGQTYTYESVNSSNPPTHEVGEQTTLLVMADDPESARENSFWELWLLPTIMCPVSGLVGVIAIVASVAVRVTKK